MAVTQQFAAGESLTAAKLNTSSIPVVSSTADIASPFTGQIVFNTTDTRLYRYSGTAWIVFTGGPTWSLSRGLPLQTFTTTATWYTMNWTIEGVDTGGMHPTNGDTVTINQAGLYAVAAKASFAPNVTGLRACRLTINGTADANTVEGTSIIQNNVGAGNVASASVPTVYVQCAVNDVLRAQAWQTSGGSLNSSAASLGDQPLFTGTWLRD